MKTELGCLFANEHCLDVIGWINACKREPAFRIQSNNNKIITAVGITLSLLANAHVVIKHCLCLAGSLCLGRSAVDSQIVKLISSFRNNCLKLFVYPPTFKLLHVKVEEFIRTCPLQLLVNTWFMFCSQGFNPWWITPQYCIFIYLAYRKYSFNCYSPRCKSGIDWMFTHKISWKSVVWFLRYVHIQTNNFTFCCFGKY